jgi:phosphoribosylformylglycinamidine cyclo-ligase
MTDVAVAIEPEHALATIGEVLLTPTRVYARAILRARRTLVDGGLDIRALAHITGGGLPGNVPRALPAGLAGRVDPALWAMPSVMRLIGALGGLEDDELRATFNGGIGMIAVVGRDAVGPTLAAFAAEGVEAALIGEVVAAEEVGAETYVEGPLGAAG